MTSLLERASAYGRMIRFSHSVFALPFALTSAALAAQGGRATGGHVFWIVVAMGAERGDGLQPPRRPGDRREEPAHRGPRAAAGDRLARRGVAVRGPVGRRLR